jgi:hypothetical protein
MECGQETVSSGFLYIIAGHDNYFRAAARSIASLKVATPDARITVFSDVDPTSRCDLPAVDSVVIKEMDTSQRMYDGKVRYICDSPYDKTICLDADTYVVGDLTPLFRLLDYHHDLALIQEPGVNVRYTRLEDGTQVIGHMQYNCGLIAFKKSDATLRLFKRWYDLFLKQIPGSGFMEGYSICREQPAFALAALESDANIYTLNHCWNARVRGPLHLTGPVVMIHARLSDLEIERVLVAINKRDKPRVWTYKYFKQVRLIDALDTLRALADVVY